MSGVGESLAINILSGVILKCLTLGYNIIQNSRLYAHEGESFNLRLRLQIGIWRAINQKISDPEIKSRMRPNDVATYSDVMKQLHGLLREYVEQKCQAGSEKTELLSATSATHLFESLEEKKRVEKSNRSGENADSKFWLSLREEAAWVAWRKGKSERLVSEIEFWGAQLDRYSSWTIPSMFPHATKADIAEHILDVSGSLASTNFKSQVMMARASDHTAMGVGGIPIAEQETFRLGIQQIKLLEQEHIQSLRGGLESTISSRSNQSSVCNGLGGSERRQWADFLDNENVSRVIVEFKPRPGPEDARFALGGEVLTNEIDNLVAALRIASQKKETFRVLYCEGWYESYDHFGLVYRLPWTEPQLICETLRNILLNHKYRELLQRDLEHRFTLAKALAWTVFELHCVDWVHQSLNPDNILLFGEETTSDVL